MNISARIFLILFFVSFHIPLIASEITSEKSTYDHLEITNKLLEDFKVDSYKFLNTIPQKYSSEPVNVYFSNENIQNQQFVELKDEYRKFILFSETRKNDDPTLLVDNGNSMLKNLSEMDMKGLSTSSLPSQPWSDAYWPLHRGNIAWRYADSHYPNSKDFIKNYYYLLNAPRLASGNSNPNIYDILSPAEKYDLLIGDTNRQLTSAALKPGKSIYDKERKVDIWYGICHGWAAASFMTTRPSKTITVTSADQRTKINFYPSDIKALSSYLWANASYTSRFIGGRCKVTKPAKNVVGRIIDQDCFDTNPATWHLSLVNQIGISRRSMVMDSTYDFEVWNQPIYSYQYSYFNPITLKSVNNMKKALVHISNFRKDKFMQFRSRRTKNIVGISMTITYIGETAPAKRITDSPKSDKKVRVTYLYDLELDSHGDIIGGEWYQNAHPDFLWTPPKETQIQSAYDKELDDLNIHWNSSIPLPREWADVARRSSHNMSLPLSKIIDALIRE